jgi:signal transduction histidine kinase
MKAGSGLRQSDHIQRREQFANYYLYLIAALGLLTVLSAVMQIGVPSDPYTFLLLMIFIGITEYAPVPIWKGSSALSFPLVYTMNLIFGPAATIVSYGLILAVVNVLRQRPIRLILFTPAQLVISLACAEWSGSRWISPLLESYGLPVLARELSLLFAFTLAYYVLNNLLVDLLLLIRPQPYTWRHWRMKSVPEAMVAGLSFLYGALMFVLGSQNRGEVDVFSFLFFFSPLVAISLISSTVVRIQKEKNRLKSLFSITTQLNQVVPSGQMDKLRPVLRDFLETQALAIWMKTNGEWFLLIQDGRVRETSPLSEDLQAKFETMTETTVYTNRRAESPSGDNLFENVIRSLVYAPLIVEHELVGMLAAGRSRTTSFTPEDIQSLATLANQLASLLKTRMLISEQKNRMLLEERNRIAREIHDGIAQSLAGAVFKLESAQRKHSDHPEELLRVMDDSVRQLRLSLREVRQSIYALRPYPTERIGLKRAILEKIESFKQEHRLEVLFHERGNPQELPASVAKTIFDTLQESLQNIAKHAKAGKVEVLLSYQSEHVLLKVKDDGIGFALFDAMIKAQREPHYGILHMNEQAERAGATLQIDSAQGDGTEIILLIPNIETKGGNEHDTRHVGR